MKKKLTVTSLEESWKKIFNRVKKTYEKLVKLDETNPLCHGWNLFPEELTPLTRKMQEYFIMLRGELFDVWRGTENSVSYEKLAPELIKSLKYWSRDTKNVEDKVDQDYLDFCAYADLLEQKIGIIKRSFDCVCLEEHKEDKYDKVTPEKIFAQDRDNLCMLDLLFEDNVGRKYTDKQYKIYSKILDDNFNTLSQAPQMQ